jgi:hypothetical protein
MTNFIDQKAETDFEGLDAFIGSLMDRSPKRGGTPQQDADENQALDELIDKYKEGASRYFNGAKRVIQEQQLDPKSRSQAYYQILSRLIEHARLLSDIVRPYLDKNNNRPKNIDLFETMMAIIASRLGTPRFLPISSQNFQYIHFHYLPKLGIIGIPPHVLGKPSWDAGVIWHEMAGHATASARRKGVLEEWAKELSQILQQQGLLDVYQGLYSHLGRTKIDAKNFLSSAAAWLWDIYQDLYSYLVRTKIDASELQAAWVGEFFEDLFGVQVVRGAMVEVLAEILVQRYKDFSRGDAAHPSSELRLQVALALLSDQERKDTSKRLESRYGPEFLSPTGDLQRVAQVIAELYQQKVENREFSMPVAEIDPVERNLGAAFGTTARQFFELAASQDLGTSPGFSNKLAAELTKVFEAAESVRSLSQGRACGLWTSAKNAAGEDVAIFFLKEVKDSVRDRIKGLISQLENDIQVNLAKGSISIGAGNDRIDVTFPTSMQRIATIVVDDVAGKKLRVNDLESLLEVQFAAVDECCGGFIGGG